MHGLCHNDIKLDNMGYYENESGVQISFLDLGSVEVVRVSQLMVWHLSNTTSVERYVALYIFKNLVPSPHTLTLNKPLQD